MSLCGAKHVAYAAAVLMTNRLSDKYMLLLKVVE